jgi:FMN reductase
MSQPSLLAVIGSATPPGRLRRAVSDAIDRHAERCGDAVELIDLAERSVSFASGAPLDALGDDSAAVVAAIARAQGVLLATPVYRGTYTGVLKNLLDLVPVEGLRGKAVGIVAMGATDHHSLGADWHLRDVLAWFGAVPAPTSVYLTSRDFADGIPGEPAAAALDALLETVGGLSTALQGVPHRLSHPSDVGPRAAPAWAVRTTSDRAPLIAETSLRANRGRS